MANTRSDDPRRDAQAMRKRIALVVDNELTDRQKYILTAYYWERKTLQVIADELGIQKSTVWRTLQRGKTRVAKYLKYL
jgi:RNA polymerase sigma factor (sigma-70 family)